jgi:hypothetical protein
MRPLTPRTVVVATDLDRRGSPPGLIEFEGELEGEFFAGRADGWE